MTGASMATTTYLSIEEYLHCSDWEPDADYVDGGIEERPMGENNHSKWQGAIQRWFWQHEEAWNVLIRPELRVRVSPTRFRIPDVAILDASLPQERIPTHPPVAVFEVLSPEDRIQRMTRKLGDYEAMGIPAIWVIDPDTGLCSRFENGQLLHAAEFSLPQRGIHFPMSEIAKLVR